MKEVINPVDKTLIKTELTPERFLRKTNKAGNEVYIINGNKAPYCMREIGRLREISFRMGGGGSGNEIDIDSHDTGENPYGQVIVWNPDDEEIIGGYRFKFGKQVTILDDGTPDMALCHIFNISEKFKSDYLPFTLELGRAFVQPKYQSTQGGLKSLFALDNLWDGIGAILAEAPETQYLIGKVTIYSTTDVEARKAMIYYLDKYFSDKENLIIPKKKEITTEEDRVKFDKIFVGNDYKEDFKKLKEFVQSRKECIPPLIHSYLDLSSTLVTFGTVFDPDFGDIYDTGMMITIKDIKSIKKERYIETYIKNNVCKAIRNFV